MTFRLWGGDAPLPGTSLPVFTTTHPSLCVDTKAPGDWYRLPDGPGQIETIPRHTLVNCRARPRRRAGTPQTTPRYCQDNLQQGLRAPPHIPGLTTVHGPAHIHPKYATHPFVQATVNHQKLTEPTPSVAWTRVLLTRYTVHGTCEKTGCTNLKTQGQSMYQGHQALISFLDTKDEPRPSQNTGVRQHKSHTVGPIEKCTAKIHSAKIDLINAQCCLDIGVAWP